jgi:hypothetical protein
MYHQIRLSEETMNRLKNCAEPFRDKDPEDVIRRLLDAHDCSGQKHEGANSSERQLERSPISRVPRERGAEVEIDNEQIRAISVPDLYKQALKLIVDKHGSKLKRLLPFATSGERYLVADKPVHPSGNPFFIPVEYDGYFMEAHKDYKNAVRHLLLLTEKLGLQLRYLG